MKKHQITSSKSQINYKLQAANHRKSWDLFFGSCNLQRGFTLVELLVSIAIIGILSSIMIVNFGGFRERTRDTDRKSDLLQIQNALELYRADNAAYPTTGNFPSCGNAFSSGGTVYFQQIPCDPLTGASWGANYRYSSNGSSYTLYACLENASDQQRDVTRQSGCSAASFTVRSQ